MRALVIVTFIGCWATMLQATTAVDYRGPYSVRSVRISPNQALDDPYIVFNDGKGNVSRGLRQYSKIKHRYTGTVMLEYTLRFSTTFPWGSEGGFLPGLIGGRSRCAKKESGSRCWRVQLTWNADGTAGVALRLPKDNVARIQGAIQNDIKWQTGQDNKITMVLGVNSKRKRDGFLEILINGELLLFQDNMVFDKQSTRNKFVLRQGEYKGAIPPEIQGEIFRYVATSNVQIFLAKRAMHVPVPSPSALLPSPPSPPPPPPPSTPDKYMEEAENDSSYDVPWWQNPIPPSLEPVTGPDQDNSGPLTISVKWTTAKMEASLPQNSPRRFDHVSKELYLCSGDKLRLEWSGETMGVYGFYSLEHYEGCIKDNLNYIKNTRPNGFFMTKANRGGWRYYAYITGADDGACKYGCGTARDKGKQITGTCAQKIAVNWDAC